MQRPNEDFSGLVWIGIGIAAYVLAYLLIRFRVLAEDSAHKFSTRVSGGIAAFIALAAVEPIEGLQDVAGGIAIFAITWLVLSVIFSIATSMAIEHQKK